MNGQWPAVLFCGFGIETIYVVYILLIYEIRDDNDDIHVFILARVFARAYNLRIWKS